MEICVDDVDVDVVDLVEFDVVLMRMVGLVVGLVLNSQMLHSLVHRQA